MSTKTILTSVILVLLMTSLCMSQYSARESFEYPVGSSLDTLLGTTGNGFTGSWDKDDGTSGLSSITDTALHYLDLANSITNIGNHALVAVPGSWTAARYARSLDKTWPDEAGKVYWISFLFEANTVPTGNTYYILKLFSNTSELVAIGKGGGGTNYTCGSGWPGGSGDDVSAKPCEGGPVWLVTKIVMTGNSDSKRTYMWVDPDPSVEPDTSTADVKRSTTNMDNGFNTVKIECGGELANNIHWDEIRLGTDYTSVSLQPTSIENQPNTQPNIFTLNQNYPNPFNPSTTITYSLKSTGPVRLTVYDITGREVAVLVDGVQNAGSHSVTFSAQGFASGVYMYKLQSTANVITKKMMLVK